MDLSRPPESHAELELWKVYVASCEAEVWQVVHRWVKRYGNPFNGRCEERSYEEAEARQLYQLALQFCYNKR